MTDTKYIVDKLFEAGIEISTHLIDSFNTLAGKFGTTASDVFDILVKKSLLLVFTALGLLVFCLYWLFFF